MTPTSLPRLDATTTLFSLSLLTSVKANASKKLIANHEGKPYTDPSHTLGITAGTIEHLLLPGLAGLSALLQSVTTRQALVHGVHKGSVPGEICELMTLGKLAHLAKQGGHQHNAIARSLEHIAYPEGVRLLMLDVDPSPGIVTPESPEALIAQLATIWPVFATVGWLAKVSTRSAIKAKSTGEWLTPPAGFHVYLLVTGDVVRWRELARVGLWLAGTGYCKLASAHAHTGVSAVLERCLIDLSVFSPERLDYVAGAIIPQDAPFYQEQQVPRLRPGEVLDLDALPDISDDNRQQYEALVHAARLQVQPEREATVRQHIASANPALDAAAITTEMSARLMQTDQGTLTPDYPLLFDHGQTAVLAGAVTAALDGKRLADPFEPDYREGTDAVFHWNGGNWLINSFAHGVMKTYGLAQPSPLHPVPDEGDMEHLLTSAAQAATWTDSFITDKTGHPKPVERNALLVFENDPAWTGVFAYNRFTERTVLRQRPPYAVPSGDPWVPRPARDTDDTMTNVWLQQAYAILAPTSVVLSVIQVVAQRQSFSPPYDYLTSLRWDGVPRLDTWLVDYAAAAPIDVDQADTTDCVRYLAYLAAVGAKTLIAGAARILDPGCKVDTMLILEGEQGLLKSTLWRTLAGTDWFLDHLGDIRGKDAQEKLIGKWIVEFSDLSAFTTAEAAQIKSFLSRNEDDFRLPYGRRSALHPRTVLFVGSTNEYTWAKDDTGNRRFWPVKVYGPCDIQGIARDRDQLWAEAVSRYRQGEPWHLEGDVERWAKHEQAARLARDDWEAPIMQWLEAPGNLAIGASGQRYTTSLELLKDALSIHDAKDHTPTNTKRIGGLLRRNGYLPKKVRVRGTGALIAVWIAPARGVNDVNAKKNNDVTDVTDCSFEQLQNNAKKNNDVTDVTDVTNVFSPHMRNGEEKEGRKI